MRGLLESGLKGGGVDVSDTVNVSHQAVMRQIVRLLEKELGKTVFRGEGSGGDVGSLW